MKKGDRRLFIEYEYLMGHFSEDMEPQFQRYSLGLKVFEMRKSTPKDAPKPPQSCPFEIKLSGLEVPYSKF